MTPSERVRYLGLTLPAPLQAPPGLVLPFVPVKVVGRLVYMAGHVPQNPDGTIWDVRGKVGAGVSEEQGYNAAHMAGLSLLASLERALGSFDHIEEWLSAFGMVNGASGFTSFPAVVNGSSDLIVKVFGPEAGTHTRSAIGVAGLPFDVPVEIEAVAIVRS